MVLLTKKNVNTIILSERKADTQSWSAQRNLRVMLEICQQNDPTPTYSLTP